MVKKSKLIFIAFIIIGFLLTLQFIILNIISGQNRPLQKSDQLWIILDDVSQSATSCDIPLILIDQRLLKTNDHASKSPEDRICKNLCRGQKVTHVATLDDYITPFKISRFTTVLETKGYSVFTSGYPDPDSNNGSSDALLFHLLIFNPHVDKNDAYLVHIAILHKKLDDYWLRGDFYLTENQQRIVYRRGVRKTDFSIPDRSNLYKRTDFELKITDGIGIYVPKDGSEFLDSRKDLEYIECNRTRAQEFYSKYPFTSDEMESNDDFRREVREILLKIIKILDDNLSIPFWLSSGTLLGQFRQCDVIFYGKDLDIGIFIDDYKPEMIDLFSMYNLPLLHVFGKREDSFELSFRNENMKIDVFFFYRETSTVWNGGTHVRTGSKYKYIFPPFHLCWTDFLHLRVRIPCPTEPYIEANYGKEWFVPNRNWNWRKSPPNVKPNGKWPVAEWPQVIQTYSMTSDGDVSR